LAAMVEFEDKRAFETWDAVWRCVEIAISAALQRSEVDADKNEEEISVGHGNW
jgi:hypothetical protein